MNKKYFYELKNLIGLSFVAIEELNNTIEHITNGNFSRKMNLAWHHIDGLLIYTARISRILWGDERKEDSKERGKEIREILKISDDSIFHYLNRKVRNDFDHIDERIDDIEKGDLTLGDSDLNIGDINKMVGNMSVGDYMRHYDQYSRIIYFGNNKLSIPCLTDELKTLETKVNKYLAK